MDRIFWRALLMALTLTVPWMFGFGPGAVIGTVLPWSASFVWFCLAVERERDQREWLEATVSNLQYFREIGERIPPTGRSCLFAEAPEAIEA